MLVLLKEDVAVQQLNRKLPLGLPPMVLAHSHRA
jgi:hypothetical protein